MFRRKVNQKREILLQAFYNLEDKLTSKLGVDDIVVAFTADDKCANKIDSIYIMAKHLSEENERVLVIDANLRSDELDNLIKVYNQKGFIDILLGNSNIEDVLITENDNLHLLVAGKVSDYEEMYLNPSSIRSFFSDAKDRYDFIFVNIKENIDILEANVIAGLCDKAVIFTSSENSKNNRLEQSIEQLEKADAKIIGVIISDYNYQEDELDDLFGGN